MKFLFTVATYYPLTDGVQMVTQYTAEELVRIGHEVTVITSTHRRTSFEREHNGVKLLYTDIYKFHGIIKGDKRKYIDLVTKEVEDKDVLINVSLQTPTTDVLLPELGKISCKKVLYLHDIHDFWWHNTDTDSLKRIISKLYYNFSYGIYYMRIPHYIRQYNLITHLSQFDLSIKYMRKQGINQNVVIGNAALDSVFSKQKKRKPCTEDYFLCVANYASHKNQLFVLKAFYQANLLNARMVFIGRQENTYSQFLRSEKTKLDKNFGQRKVDFFVDLPREETEQYIANANAMVLGSRIEKFPVVLVESIASKVPFIATDTGSVRYIPGGFVVRSEEEMAYWMEFVLCNKTSAQLLGESGYEYAIKNMTVKSKVTGLIEAISDNCI